MTHTVIVDNAVSGLRSLPDASIHCVVTSPPYYGLRNYKAGALEIGQEKTPAEYVASLVSVFREVRRVLRPDGTLFLNLGDTYANDTKWGGSTGGKHAKALHGNTGIGREKKQTGLKPKDLIGIPWRVALALQADGWWLRSDVIWHKTNPMTESCTDRFTRSHEYIFMLTRSPRYFFDWYAVQEPAVYGEEGACRRKRSVWSMACGRYKGAHFATFPEELPRHCILAGTSAGGCCSKCGAPLIRNIESKRVPTRPGKDTKIPGRNSRMFVDRDPQHKADERKDTGNRDPLRHVTQSKSTGWLRGCKCGKTERLPCVVLDPFAGAFTTSVAAQSLGRSSIGIELNPEYAQLGKVRISDAAASGRSCSPRC